MIYFISPLAFLAGALSMEALNRGSAMAYVFSVISYIILHCGAIHRYSK